MHDPIDRRAAEQTPADDDPRRLTAALGYVFTPVVPLLTLANAARDDHFSRRHAIQALLWAVPFVLLLFATVFALVLLVRDDFLFICLMPLLIVVPFLPGAFWARRVYLGGDVTIPIISSIAASRV